MKMNRRKFFQRLGLTAVATAITPELLASPTNKGPRLTMDFGGEAKPFVFEYLKAWKKPVRVTPDITVMFLPRQLGWAPDTILIRSKGYQNKRIEIEKREDVYVYMPIDKLVIEPKTYTFPDELGTIAIQDQHIYTKKYE